MERGGLILSVVVALVLIAIAAPAPGQTDVVEVDFKVVVNAGNPIQRLTNEQLSRIFLKKTLLWHDDILREDNAFDEDDVFGEEVSIMPLDLPSESAVRSSFSRRVHGREVASVKSYWQQMIFSGRDIPPRELASEDQVLELIRSNRGAIGYVAAAAEVGEGIKELEVSYTTPAVDDPAGALQ